jgi:hypothetical protein
MGDTFAHFTVGGLAPRHNKLTDYTLTFPSQFHHWGFECNVVEKSDLCDYNLPPAD